MPKKKFKEDLSLDIEESTKCPYCFGKISLNDVKCEYCGENINIENINNKNRFIDGKRIGKTAIRHTIKEKIKETYNADKSGAHGSIHKAGISKAASAKSWWLGQSAIIKSFLVVSVALTTFTGTYIAADIDNNNLLEKILLYNNSTNNTTNITNNSSNFTNNTTSNQPNGTNNFNDTNSSNKSNSESTNKPIKIYNPPIHRNITKYRTI